MTSPQPIPAVHPWTTQNLLTIFHELPDLPDAACKGNPGYWDDWIDTPGGQREKDAERHARHYLAMKICDRCPELFECRQQRDAHPEWGGGIWGGQLFEPTSITSKIADHDCARPGCFNPASGKYCSKKCRQAMYDAAHREQKTLNQARRRAEKREQKIREAA